MFSYILYTMESHLFHYLFGSSDVVTCILCDVWSLIPIDSCINYISKLHPLKAAYKYWKPVMRSNVTVSMETCWKVLLNFSTVQLLTITWFCCSYYGWYLDTVDFVCYNNSIKSKENTILVSQSKNESNLCPYKWFKLKFNNFKQ